MSNLFVAIDPSFTNTGLAFCIPDRGVITLASVFKPLGQEVNSFTGAFNSARQIASNISPAILLGGGLDADVKSVSILIESPPPNAIFSAGMWCICTAICNQLILDYGNQDSDPERFGFELGHTMPSTIKSILKLKSKRKGPSVKLFLDLYVILAEEYKLNVNGVSTATNKRIKHDLAEAFILLVFLMYRRKAFSPKIMEALKDYGERFETPKLHRII